MAELAPRPAWAGLDLPVTTGGVTLSAAPDAPTLSIGALRAGAGRLETTLGAAPPAPGRVATLDDGTRIIWAGLDQWLMRGPAATPALAERLAGVAAVADQSDGWTELVVAGAATAEVLARLTPVDLAPAAFAPGAALRSELRHVPALIVARDGGVAVFVPRSYTGTAVHEIATAMRAVAARAMLR